MAILGAHQSIAGGYYKAVERAHATGCDCVQLFTYSNQQWPFTGPRRPKQDPTLKTASQFGRLLTKNNNQWRAKPISTEEAQQFKDALKKHKVKHPLAHDSYLINLASPDRELWKKSIDSFVVELLRAEQLGIPFVVTHPGAYTTATEGRGIKRAAKALDEVHRQTRGIAAKALLENTAGQGSCLGWRLEQLAAIRDAVQEPERLGGVCLDTCHLFAAGYPLAGEKNYQATMRAIDQAVGLKSVKAWHLNDSKTRLGSRVDRHAHIGRGEIGVDAFRRLVNDRRWARTPMYIETNKGEENGVDLDVINLNTLRGLVKNNRDGTTARRGSAKNG